jgi:CRISPR system Cascade subunit CasD
VDDLANLKMGVRVDREGVVNVDYHTAGGTHRKGESYGVLKATGLVSRDAVTSNRYYLADADFLIGLSGDGSLLQEAGRAIAEPVMQIYLGRKSFVPATPVHIPDGFRTESDLESALVRYPWPRLGVRVPGKRPDRLRFVIEADNSESGEIRRDQPVGAAFLHRRFLLRHVKTSFHALGDEVPMREE